MGENTIRRTCWSDQVVSFGRSAADVHIIPRTLCPTHRQNLTSPDYVYMPDLLCHQSISRWLCLQYPVHYTVGNFIVDVKRRWRLFGLRQEIIRLWLENISLNHLNVSQGKMIYRCISTCTIKSILTDVMTDKERPSNDKMNQSHSE